MHLKVNIFVFSNADEIKMYRNVTLCRCVAISDAIVTGVLAFLIGIPRLSPHVQLYLSNAVVKAISALSIGT